MSKFCTTPTMATTTRTTTRLYGNSSAFLRNQPGSKMTQDIYKYNSHVTTLERSHPFDVGLKWVYVNDENDHQYSKYHLFFFFFFFFSFSSSSSFSSFFNIITKRIVQNKMIFGHHHHHRTYTFKTINQSLSNTCIVFLLNSC